MPLPSPTLARFLALILACGALGQAAGDDGGEGIEVLSRFLEAARLEPGEEVLGMAGFFGEPLPAKWLVLTGAPGGGPLLRESVCVRDQVVSVRQIEPRPGQAAPVHPLKPSALKIPAAQAYRIVTALAGERGIPFESAHFQLQVREPGLEPVWMLSLLNRGRVRIGSIDVSAIDGRILGETWTGRSAAPVIQVSAR